MKKDDKLTLILFISLILLIGGLLIFNIYKNNKDKDVDRKIKYIFDELTYNDVYEKSSKLFTQGIELLNNKDIYNFEKDNNSKIKYYSIKGYNYYKKILNFTIVNNTFKESEVTKYMDLKKIINYENNYYIKKIEEEENNKYIGSIIKIESYDSKYVYFRSTNYYCENSSYIGLLEDVPSCNYQSTETNFTVIYENNKLKINSLEEIENILK